MKANILAIDSTTENCSVALSWQGQLYIREALAPRDHSKKILPFVEQVLAEAKTSLRDLDALAFGRGPGSFTGVRISVATAQGLAYGAKLPMIGVSTLQAMAQSAHRQAQAEHCFAAIDARMNEIYWGHYQAIDGLMCPVGPEQVISPDLLNGTDESALAVGTGWQSYAKRLSRQFPGATISQQLLYPTAQDMLNYAQVALVRGETVTADNAEPVYLRDKVTWKKLPGRE